MAVTFLEPGGDANFTNPATNLEFWSNRNGSPTIVSDFVHGTHVKSIKFGTNSFFAVTKNSVLSGSGSRTSAYIYINALPTATVPIFNYITGATFVLRIQVTSAGVLQLWSNTAQIGSDGSTLSTGVWYRISLAYTVSSTSVNEMRVFKDGKIDISVTNATLPSATISDFIVGFTSSDTTFDLRTSDHYVDNSTSLLDTGDIWVIAKRPNANGTTNGFTTQIGASGSGYGTGHSPQVNERPLSTTNGWSMIGAGAAITEEYNVESKATGDIDISTFRIVDTVGWAYMSALAGETVQMIVNGVNFAQAITSSNTLYTKIAGSNAYPSGTGADIGITTDTSLTTVSLFECGILVAAIPTTTGIGNYPPFLRVGNGMSRSERAT